MGAYHEYQPHHRLLVGFGLKPPATSSISTGRSSPRCEPRTRRFFRRPIAWWIIL